jgi:hypothetical protein
LGETRFLALGQQVEAQAGDAVEPLVGFHTRQTKGGPAFEREQVARVAQELGDDLLGFRIGRRGGGRGRWALAGWRRGLFQRAWQQAGYG